MHLQKDKHNEKYTGFDAYLHMSWRFINMPKKIANSSVMFWILDGLFILQTFEETERRHWESMENEWEREKQKILNALVGSSQDGFDFPQEVEVSFQIF